MSNKELPLTRRSIGTFAVGGIGLLAGCAAPSDPETADEEDESEEEEPEEEEPEEEESEEEEPDPPVSITTSWEYEALNTFNEVPAYRDGEVYITNDDAYLYALDVRNQDERWRFELDRSYGFVPEVSSELVFINDRDRHALDRTDGETVWEQDRGRGALAYSDGQLFMADGGIKKVDPQSGEILWEYQALIFGSSPVFITQNKAFSLGGNEVFAVNQSDGEEVWTYRAAGDTTTSGFQVTDNWVVFQADDDRIYVLDPDSGEEEYLISTERGAYDISVIDNTLCYRDREALFGYDLQQGEEKWRIDERPISGAQLSRSAFDDLLVFASRDGIGIIELDTGDVFLLQEIEWDHRPRIRPIVRDGMIIIPDDMQSLLVFEFD